MKFRKWTTGLLAAALLVSIAGTALADDNTNVPGAMYTDTQAQGMNKPLAQVAQDIQKLGIKDIAADTPFAGSITIMVEAGLMELDQNGSFNPTAKVNGAEGLQVFTRVLGITGKGATPEQAVEAAREAGLLEGSYSIQGEMSRLQIAKLLAKALGIDPVEVTSPSTYPFADFDGITREDRMILAALYHAGIFKGDGGLFYPHRTLTRVEVAILVDRILGAQ